MKFFSITSNRNPNINRLLQSACLKRGIQYIETHPASFSFIPPLNLLSVRDAVYRVATDTPAKNLEKFLLVRKPITFYASVEIGVFRVGNNEDRFLLDLAGVPTPKTIHLLTGDRSKLKKQVEYLGGFPVVIKALGGSHGVGVMRVDSLVSLFSIADYLTRQDDSFILRQFIPAGASARLIILGNRIIDSIEYQAPLNDFRSNLGNNPTVIAKKFPEIVNSTAIEAVRSVGVKFGGVDILIDDRGNPYVTEVNFPCNFARCQMLTGRDIAGMMIDYLIEKGKRGV